MKPIAVLIHGLLITLALTGCTITPTIPRSQILPLADTKRVPLDLTKLFTTGFNLTEASLEATTATNKTRMIATTNGRPFTVNIYYTDRSEISGDTPLRTMAQLLSGGTLEGLAPAGLDWTYKGYVKNMLLLADKLRNFQGPQFQSNLLAHVSELQTDQTLGTGSGSATNQTIRVSLDAILTAYLKAYLDGSYVDRWGVSISQPDLSKIGSDTAAPFAKVAFEAFFDYSLMTPIVHDSTQSSTNKTPTFAVIFPQLYEQVSANTDAPGITSDELEAISYLSGLGAEGAKHMSSLFVKTLGGAAVGAKVSVGDNTTFSQIISTLCEEISKRTTEEISYDFFEKFEYTNSASTVSGYIPDFKDNDKNFQPNLTHEAQTGVVTLLVSQDKLKTLLHGKPSPPAKP
jgi:hypothetical protein